MYCPEKMAQLSDEELKTIVTEFDERGTDFYGHHTTDDHEILKGFYGIKHRFFEDVRDQDAGDLSVHENSPEELVHTLKYMIEFFRPRYIISETLKIGQEMEALGCNGTVIRE